MARWSLLTSGNSGRFSDDDLRMRLGCRVSEIARFEASLAAAVAGFNSDCAAGERNGQAAIVDAARRELAMRSVARVRG